MGGASAGSGGGSGWAQYIPMALQGLGALTSGNKASGNATANRSAYLYQAAMARNNAELSRYSAKDAITRGQHTEVNSRLRQGQLASTQRASLAARGLSLAEGSPLNIVSDTEIMGNSDADTIRHNAAMEAWGHNVRGSNATADANMLEWRANQEDPEGDMLSTLLTGAGSVASSWFKIGGGTGGGEDAAYRERLNTAASQYKWD